MPSISFSNNCHLPSATHSHPPHAIAFATPAIVFTIQEIAIIHANFPEKPAPKLDIAFSASYLCSTHPALTQPHGICHPVSLRTHFPDFFVRFSAKARNL